MKGERPISIETRGRRGVDGGCWSEVERQSAKLYLVGSNPISA